MGLLKCVLVLSGGSVCLMGCSSAPPTVTVHGTVADAFGTGASGQTVVIFSGSFSQTVVTDASGSFSVANVPTPYSAALVLPQGVVTAFAGLTRLDPVLPAPGTYTAAHTATLTGRFLGGNYPESPNDVTAFVFTYPQTAQVLLPEVLPDQPSGTYALSLVWLGPSSTTGTLYALQVHTDADSGVPLGYPGYGTLSGITLEDGETLTGQDVTLGPVSTGTVSGTFNPAPGDILEPDSASLELVVAPGVTLPILQYASIDASFSYTVPTIPGTSVLLGANAYNPQARYNSVLMAQEIVSAPVSGVAVDIPAAPQLLTPTANATGVSINSALTWTPTPQALYLLEVMGGGVRLVVFTSASSFTFPDLADAGLALLPSMGYQWQVYAFVPVASIDAMVVPDAIEALSFGNLSEAPSVPQGFSTGP